MRETITVKDVFDALISLEEAGRDAYRLLADAAADDHARGLFADLSRREEAHRKLYTEMSGKIVDSAAPDLDEEYREYLSVVLEHNFDLVRSAARPLGWEEGIAVGIELERQTIMFLSDLYRLLDGTVREPLLAVLREEQGHLRALLTLRKNQGRA